MIDRDSYKDALSSVKLSISSLMPLIPSIQSMAGSGTSPGVVDTTEMMMSPDVTTPTCTKMVSTAHSVDSGLSSQQPSTSRINEGVWPSPHRSDGSILKAMPQALLPDLSITQINEEDDPPDYHVTYTTPTLIKEQMAPELSIVHIDQSDSTVVIPPVIPANIIDEVQGIQGTIVHVHVCHLILHVYVYSYD